MAEPTVSGISADDIEVDEAGRVIVTNPNLAAQLSEEAARKRKVTITNKSCPITNQGCARQSEQPELTT